MRFINSGSQGFVIYKIRLLDNLAPETGVDNTAYIYFDENPPVITNTASHTIFSCDMMPQYTESFSACPGENSFITTVYPYVDQVEWQVFGETVSNENTYNFPTESGSYFIQLILTNPLCTVTSDYYYEVYPTPEVTISEATVS